MKHEEENNHLLAKEMAELWFECRIRCDRIEELAKKLKNK